MSDRIGRAVKAVLGTTASLFSQARKRMTREPVHAEIAAPAPPPTPRRVWFGAIALTAFSPIFAIPSVVVMAIVLAFANSTLADAELLAFSFTPITRIVLGSAFVILVLTLDFVLRGFLLTAPLFLLAGFGAAKWADRAGSYWKRLLAAGVLIGALYPAIFVVGDAMGWFDEPLFN